MCTSTSRLRNLRKTCKTCKTCRTCRNETKNFQNESNNQRPRNLKNKGDDYSDTELTIIFCVIYFSFLVWEFDSDPSKSGKYTQRFTEAGAGSY